MRKSVRLLLAVGTAILLMEVSTPRLTAAESATGPETTAQQSISVGDFLVRYARAMNLPLSRKAGPEEAFAELRDRGVVEGEVNLDRPLTEGDIIRFASRAGLRLTTLDETRPFPAAKVDAFFDAFGGVLSDPSVTEPGAPAANDSGVLGADTCDPNQSNCGEGSERAREKRKKKKDRETPPDP